MQEKNIFYKSEQLLGERYYEKLAGKKVCLFGLGGVGGYTAEILVRSGISNFVLIDGDTVDITNLNRQIIATRSTVGMSKCVCAKKRILDINPDAQVEVIPEFLLPESKELEMLFDAKLDFVIDAVDTISLKVAIAQRCEVHGIPLVSATGCGNRINASYQFADIYKTSHCPVCKILRKRLKESGVKRLKVLYSPTEALPIHPVASVPWTPALAGIMLGAEVVQELLNR
ncbi:MAG: tRNA threonylcarbamoyladenosine dehydratase [Treponemataceae bacterium]